MDSTVEAKIQQFFKPYAVRKYSKGEVLLLVGDDVQNVFQIVEGRVKEYDVTNRGDEVTLNIFTPPAFFPMSAVINKSTSPYIFETETACKIRLVPAQEVLEFITNNPDVLYDLISRVYRGVDSLLGRVVHLMASSANTRLVYELLVEARRFGQARGNSTVLNINEKDLGARAGLSRETVSREIGKLRAEGLLTTSPKTIVLNNQLALRNKLAKQI